MKEITESRFSWFCQGPLKDKYVKGAIIETQHPTPGRWRIREVSNEHDHQLDEEDPMKLDDDTLSFITTRLQCCRDDAPRTYVEIRVYVQIPKVNTEFEPSEIRAQQAVEWEPAELRAYKIMSADPELSQFTPELLGYEVGKQGDEGYVPGGFHITIVWERVPGKKLGDGRAWGDYMSESPFWKLTRSFRDKIRTQFKDTYIKMRALGISPEESSSDNLVFHRTREHLYWVGFYNAEFVDKDTVKWSDTVFVNHGLAIPPEKDVSWDGEKPAGDTSKWKF